MRILAQTRIACLATMRNDPPEIPPYFVTALDLSECTTSSMSVILRPLTTTSTRTRKEDGIFGPAEPIDSNLPTPRGGKVIIDRNVNEVTHLIDIGGL